MINTDELLSKLNIIDVINNSGLYLKKAGGSHVCCCPFHSEKTPSFHVSESKQVYNCFGCGAKGNAIGFVMDFQSVDFREACKMLGADISATPSVEIQRNMNRVISNLPSYDKRDKELCAKMLESAEILASNHSNYYLIDGDYYQGVIDSDGDIVNLYNLVTGDFVAGGVSHLAYTAYRFDENIDTALIVSDYNDAIKIGRKYKKTNIIVSHSPYNTKLLTECGLPFSRIPVIKEDDTLAHSLTDLWLWAQYDADTNVLTKKMKGEDFD